MINRIKISKNFYLDEFDSPDTKEVKIHPDLVEKLQKLRDHFKKPVIINSGYRTKEWNKRVGGIASSKHMEGLAADIRVPGVSSSEVAKVAEKIGFKGIGLYRNFCHVDVRSGALYKYTGKY